MKIEFGTELGQNAEIRQRKIKTGSDPKKWYHVIDNVKSYDTETLEVEVYVILSNGRVLVSGSTIDEETEVVTAKGYLHSSYAVDKRTGKTIN